MIDFPGDPRGRELILLVERLKYERWLASELDDLIEREFNRAVDTLVSGQYRDLTQFQQQRLAQLFQALGKRMADAYKEVIELQLTEMKKYARFEAELAEQIVQSIYAAAGSPIVASVSLPRGYLASIAKLPIQGLNIGEWFDAQARTMTLETRRIIQQALVEGRSPLEIARKIVAPASAEGPVLLRRAKNEARIISRTIVNAVQNDAQMTSLSSLPASVSDSYVYEAVLDSRTTTICRALSGRVFRYDDPRRKVPPQHVGCRSSVRSLLKGINEPMTDQKTPRTLKNYETWLRTQPSSAQNDILGPSRASLWRSGSMTLSDAIDQDNRVLTLPQLRARLGLSTVGAT